MSSLHGTLLPSQGRNSDASEPTRWRVVKHELQATSQFEYEQTTVPKAIERDLTTPRYTYTYTTVRLKAKYSLPPLKLLQCIDVLLDQLKVAEENHVDDA